MNKMLLQTIKRYQPLLYNLLLKVYFEAFIATSIALFIGYLLSKTPATIPWMKLIPTLLIAFPVYGSRSCGIATWGGSSPAEKMDALFFKIIYCIGVTWLAFDIFKGII